MKSIQKVIPNVELTPVLCFKAVGKAGCCILESAKTSFIGIGPMATFQAKGRSIEIDRYGQKQLFEGDPYEALQHFAKDRKAFGLIGYDAVRLKETLPDRHPSKGIPDFFFHIYQTIIEFDHNRGQMICTHEGSEQELDAILDRCYETPRFKPFNKSKKLKIDSSLSRNEYADLVEKAKEYIEAGDIFQVVLSRIFQVDVQASPFEIYRAIRQVSCAPYLFFFEEVDFALAGASPELLISVNDGRIESMPIAGTCGQTERSEDLLKDPKECAEHVMLIDLARNDVGAVACIGSVRVSDFMMIQSFSHVQHIVSRVVGHGQSWMTISDIWPPKFSASFDRRSRFVE